jgi:hypothetical protein
MPTKEEIFDYLTALRDSGVTNMMFAPRYLMDAYGIDKRDAMKFFSDWCESLRSKS